MLVIKTNGNLFDWHYSLSNPKNGGSSLYVRISFSCTRSGFTSGDVEITQEGNWDQRKLKHTTTVQFKSCFIEPKRIVGLPLVVSVNAGYYQSFFIDEKGSVWACGEIPLVNLGWKADREKNCQRASPIFRQLKNVFLPLILQYLWILKGNFGAMVFDKLERSQGTWKWMWNCQLQWKICPFVNLCFTYLLDENGVLWQTTSSLLNLDSLKSFSGAFFTIAIDEEGAIWGSGSLRFHKEKVQLFTKLSTLPILEPQEKEKN